MKRATVVLWALVIAGASGASGQDPTLSLSLSSEEHRVDAGSGVARTSGLIPGGMLDLGFGSHWGIQLTARSGTLGAARALDAEKLAEVGAVVRVSPAGWVAFEAEARARSLTTTLDRQHWTTASLGADLRVPFIGSATEGYLHLGLPFLVAVNGLASPNVAIEGGAGLSYRRGRLQGTLAYELRRFDFPPAAGQPRLEEFSILTLGMGLSIGQQ